MKKGVLIILLFLLITNVSAIKVITGETVTGKATSHQTNVSIKIIAYPPNITLYGPENKTYIRNSSIPINYSCPTALATWYSLDNSENLTLTQGTTFSAAEGAHNLNIYANNSDGIESNLSINFYINTSLLTIIYEEYKGAYKGNSTYFEEYVYEDLQNISNIILENTNYGKIKFNQNINITEDSNFSDRTLDLDSNTNVSFNRIELDATNLPNFNKPSTLWLYGLTYSNPKVLKDGANCTACKIENYSGGTLKFNITGFSVYSAAETTSTTPTETPSPGGGGGGGGVLRNRTLIEIEYPFPQEEIYIRRGAITLTIKQGGMKVERIEIDNRGNKKIIVRVYALNITEYLQINETDFEMPADSSENISVEFLIPESLLPNIYIGKLVIESGNQTREIPISINVISKNPDLEVTTKIPERFLQIKAGKEIEGIITINNFEDVKGTATLEYGVLNEYNALITNYTEIAEIENLIELIRKIRLPSDLKPGRYLFYAKVTFKDKTYSSSSWFYIKKPLLPYTITICMIIGVVILYFLFRKKKPRKEEGREEEKKTGKKDKIKNKVPAKKYVMKNGYLEIKS
ncbi:hypothetical protein A3K73_02945 [Candidatus Pacearchaeota archaeon RBG_13_36_9]|nr:MAG: hypothetical protein A3K73_02945 [Candidatus Pacearchaeota archaeon RBG_13_36_9]